MMGRHERGILNDYQRSLAEARETIARLRTERDGWKADAELRDLHCRSRHPFRPLAHTW